MRSAVCPLGLARLRHGATPAPERPRGGWRIVARTRNRSLAIRLPHSATAVCLNGPQGDRMRRAVSCSAATIAVSVALLTCSTAAWCQHEGILGHVAEFEARETAVEAYIFGYPLVTMEMTRRVMTNVAAPEGTRAPMGQFVRMRTYPSASFRDVTAPNADTLYTTTWLDVSKEPWVLSHPD